MNTVYGYCGMPCALCTRYRTDGKSRCPGCSADGYYTDMCKVHHCCKEKGLLSCGQCPDFPCARLGKMGDFRDLNTGNAKQRTCAGIAAYGFDHWYGDYAEKAKLLTEALEKYNNGRMKRFICQLFIQKDLPQLRELMSRAESITAEPKEAGNAFRRLAEGMDMWENIETELTAEAGPNAGARTPERANGYINKEDKPMTEKNYIIRPETPADYAEVENLVREAFWNVYRPGCYEHYVMHIMRDNKDFVKELDYVMEKDGKIIGQVVYTRAKIEADDGRIIPVMTMGPIGILPEYKRQGYGKALLDYSLEKAALLDAGAVCFEGNIDFYGKSGFVVASTMGIHYYDEPRENPVPYFLCKELTPGYLSGVEGVFLQPLADFVDEAAAEEFDRRFPPKEKLKLPGQLV